jgi:hypothetical protein
MRMHISVNWERKNWKDMTKEKHRVPIPAPKKGKGVIPPPAEKLASD